MPSDLTKIARAVGDWVVGASNGGGELVRTPENLARVMASMVNGTVAGPISEGQAMRVSAVYACVRLLSDSIAMLPCALFKKDGEKGASRI